MTTAAFGILELCWLLCAGPPSPAVAEEVPEIPAPWAVAVGPGLAVEASVERVPLGEGAGDPYPPSPELAAVVAVGLGLSRGGAAAWLGVVRVVPGPESVDPLLVEEEESRVDASVGLERGPFTLRLTFEGVATVAAAERRLQAAAPTTQLEASMAF